MKNDKSDTIKFEPVNRNIRERSENDRYSEGRKQPEREEKYSRKSGNSDKTLKLAVLCLIIVLLIVITAGIIIIGNPENKKAAEEDSAEITEETTETEEEKEENINEAKEYDVVFYGESIKTRDDRVEIKADLYDEDFKRVDTRKIIINSSTKIKENGKRITPESLCYIVESFTGDMIIFNGVIREDGYAESLSFDGDFRDEIESDEPKEEEVDEAPPKKTEEVSEETEEKMEEEITDNTEEEEITPDEEAEE